MTTTSDPLKTFLYSNPSTTIIRFHWVDFSGVLRTRFVPTKRSLEIARGKDTYTLAQNCMIIPISTAPECFPTGAGHERWHLIPDWSSLRRCGFAPGHAAVMCFVDQQNSETRFGKCPRTLLNGALEQLESAWGGKLLVGFEIEFVLLDETLQLFKSMDALKGYSRTAGLRAETLGMVEEIISALNEAEIDVYHFHTEIADQLEIALAPQSPMEAIDALVLAQETIRTVCVRHKVRASLTPKPVLDGPQNGCHLHLSIANVARPDDFLAGILSHMGSLCAFGMANYDGYVRIVDDAAGAWIGWGTDQRDLPVRKVGENHWEFRMMDCTANPYLFVAGVVLAGLDGLQKKSPLRWKDCSVFLHKVDADQRQSYGIERAMPMSLRHAVTCLKEEAAVKGWMTSEMLQQYVAIKEKEIDTFEKMSDEQRRIRFLDYF